jgi:hypothetical protein
MTRHLCAFVAAALLATIASSPSLAAWPPHGLPISMAPGIQHRPRLATDLEGGAFVAWRDRRHAGDAVSGEDVYATRVSEHGDMVAGWTPDGTPIDVGPGDQLLLWVVTASNGDLVMAVYRAASPALVLHRRTPSGAVASGWPAAGLIVMSGPLSEVARLVADPFGGIFVVWTDFRTGNPDLHAQHVDVAGAIAAGWPAGGLAIATGAAGTYGPDACSDGNDGLLIAWHDDRDLGAGTHLKIWASRVRADGTLEPGWITGGSPVFTAPRGGELARIAPDDLGGAYVAWVDHRSWPVTNPSPEQFLDIFAHHLLLNGTRDPAWPANGLPIATTSATEWDASLIADGLGGAFVVWSSSVTPRLQRLVPQGIAAGWPVGGLTPAAGATASFGGLSLHSDGAAGALVGWWHGGDPRHQVQRVQSNGTLFPGWPASGRAIDSDGVPQLYGSIAGDGVGGVYVAWSSDDAFADVFLQHLSIDGVVGVQVACIGFAVTTGSVRVEWQTSGDAVAGWVVERSEDDVHWNVRASVTPDGSGRIVHVDQEDVVAGARYGYRLGWTLDGSDRRSSPTWVEIPAAAGLSLAGFQPNPAAGTARVRYTTPVAGPAEIELLDLAGRRLAHRRVMAAPGPAECRFDVATLAPGVYLVRLRQLDRTVTTRGVVSR